MPTGRWGRFLRAFWNAASRPAWSGAAIIAGAYNKPILALLGLPALYLAYRAERLRGAAKWLAGAAARASLVCGISIGFTGHPSAYLGRRALGRPRPRLHDRMPDLPIARSEAHKDGGRPRRAVPRNSWSWIFRLPEVDHRLPENVRLLLRRPPHRAPPLRAVRADLRCCSSRSTAGARPERWALLAALAGVALLLPDPHPVQLARRRRLHRQPLLRQRRCRRCSSSSPASRRAWLPVAGFALGGLFVGPILFTPFGAPVPSPTLQAHVRNAPFRFFPFERTLARQIPGYRGQVGSGIYFFGRRDVLSPVGESLWAVGGKPVELWVHTDQPARSGRSSRSRPRSRRTGSGSQLGDDRKEIHFDSATPPGNIDPHHARAGRARARPRRRRRDGTTAYKLLVTAEPQAWKEVPFQPPRSTSPVPTPPHARSERRSELARPGTRSGRQEFDGAHLPGRRRDHLPRRRGASSRPTSTRSSGPPARRRRRWRADRLVRVRATVRNTSAATWRARGATRVALAYHWLDERRQRVVCEGLRTPLPDDVAAGRRGRGRRSRSRPRNARPLHPRARRAARAARLVLGQAPGSRSRIPVEVVPVETSASPEARVTAALRHPARPPALRRRRDARPVRAHRCDPARPTSSLRRVDRPRRLGTLRLGRGRSSCSSPRCATSACRATSSACAPMPLGNLLRRPARLGHAPSAALTSLAAPLLAGAFSHAAPRRRRVLRVLVLYLLLEGLAVVPLTWFEADAARSSARSRPSCCGPRAYCAPCSRLGARAAGGSGRSSCAQIVAQAVYAAVLWWRARPATDAAPP